MARPSAAWRTLSITVITVGGFLLVLYGALWHWSRSSPNQVESPIPFENRVLDSAEISPNPGYLGAQACRQCHTARVAEFCETRHFAANCVPQADRMPHGFSTGSGTCLISDPSIRFEMNRTEKGFCETAILDTSSGIQKNSSAIAFCYGSKGGNDEVYFTWHGNGLFELPVAWLAPQNEWGTSPFDRHGNGDFSRDTTIRCVECHNTWVEHVPGTRNQFVPDHWILGVTCEVCHGPGRDHVSFHEKNPQVTEPHSVVRPAFLSRERKMDLCAQCHSNALKHRGPTFSYRPGQPLNDFYFSLRTSRPEDDHVANQTTYLRQSRCFQKSDSLTCVTCHNPHQPRSATNAGAASCRTCHSNTDCAERSRLPAAVQDDCIKCHMPEGRKIQVFFRTESDKYVAPVKRYEHRIGIYPNATSEVLLEWHRSQTDPASIDEADKISKALGESLSAESENLSREYRYLAAINACRESIRFAPDPAKQDRLAHLISIQWGIDTDLQDGIWHEKEGRYTQAIESLQRVLKAKPDHAMALGKLGTTYAVVKQPELAVKHLKAAASYDHDDPYPLGMLGWLAYLDGRADEALEYYQQAEEVEPYSAQINYQMGLALSKLSRVQLAIDRYQKVIQIDPKHVAAHLALSKTLQQLGKPNDALHHSLRAGSISGFRDPEILLNLAESYANANQFDEAIKTAQRALDESKARPPQLASRIRDRIEAFKSRGKGHTKPQIAR